MIGNKFTYFLNAVHYCMWINEQKFQRMANKHIYYMFKPINKYLLTKKFREKYFANLSKEQNNINNIYNNKKDGILIGQANHWFGYLYSCYPGYISFILLALTMRYIHDMYFVVLLVVGLPIGIFYIPAYKAVFYKDRYLEYFKKFEKEDERWHKKWSRITTTFCIGAILMSLLGLASMFFICIYFDL